MAIAFRKFKFQLPSGAVFVALPEGVAKEA